MNRSFFHLSLFTSHFSLFTFHLSLLTSHLSLFTSLNCHALREVPWLVHIRTFRNPYMVGQ
jgi:hypothetical protein